MARPILSCGIFPLREKFDDPRDRRQLTAGADLFEPVLTTISQDVEEGPLEEDVVRKSNGVPTPDVLQDAVNYELIDQALRKAVLGA